MIPRLGSRLVGACALVALAGASAQAASLMQVNGWQGGASLPSDVSMYVYKPDKVAAKPPIVTLIHYCGGTAQAVFGQAQTGKLVAAADQYGFIFVVPSSGRCWDVTSAKTHKRDGGGDTHAIAQMVRFAITQYQGNADRVYSTGDSSGGMMTELMLGLYPDIFKGGSAFAGVPAGCSNEFDGAGLCGLSAQTAQQWGDRVRAMYPGYTGHRPRVQLFHGDRDCTIAYKNFGEGIKEWTDVLGLATSPTSTDDTVTLGNNDKATRQSWKNACGYVVLDAFTEHGSAAGTACVSTGPGDHGPSDTLFVAKYVVPFLGLDKTGDVDPEIEQCGASGAGGAGTGAAGRGGTATGGAGGGGSGSAGRSGNTDGGMASSGGAGGDRSDAGATGGSGGTASSGGTTGGPDASASGGSGGSASSGGTTGGPDASASGGSGQVASSGGATASGGSTSSSSGGKTGSGGSTGSGGGGQDAGAPASGGAASGCSCAIDETGGTSGAAAAMALALALVTAGRRRRRR